MPGGVELLSRDQERPPLLVFADDWGRHPSSCQHLIRHLLERHAVTWVNTIGTRPPRLDRATLRRASRKLSGWARPATVRAGRATGAGPVVAEAKMWPWLRSTFDRSLNRALMTRQIRRLIAQMPRPPVAVTTVPVVADLVGSLPVMRWVYYCVDDFGSWPGLDQEAMGRLDEQLIRSADLLIAAGEALRRRIEHFGREAQLLTHGVDLNHWSAGPDTSLPRIDSLEPPLIVYWGVIDRRMDAAFVSALDAALPAGTIVLVGPSDDPDPSLSRLNRVVRLPALPYNHLPSLARRASVLIMPYADLPVTRAMQPLKLTECLAAGKPVVARQLPSTREWADALDQADTPEAFAAAVRLRLDTGLPSMQRNARERLVSEDWSAKAQLFEEWVTGPLPRDRGDAYQLESAEAESSDHLPRRPGPDRVRSPDSKFD
jgi:glycosyltransferase involved in cell wall biosynthesis